MADLGQSCPGPQVPIEVNFNGSTCGPKGPKIFSWGPYGPRAVLEAETGDKLEVRCDPVPANLLAFVLYHTPAGSTIKQPLCMCPFEAGCNSFRLTYSPGATPVKPSCFVETLWISRDYNENDGTTLANPTNYWTGERPEAPPTLDWAFSLYDFRNGLLTRTVVKHTYREGPPLPFACRGVAPSPEVLPPVSRAVVNPLIWPLAVDASTSLVPATEPRDLRMEGSPFSLADLNRDGKKDATDFQLFQSAFGTCVGNLKYVTAADMDGDGCITLKDYQTWLGLYNAR